MYPHAIPVGQIGAAKDSSASTPPSPAVYEYDVADVRSDRGCVVEKATSGCDDMPTCTVTGRTTMLTLREKVDDGAVSPTRNSPTGQRGPPDALRRTSSQYPDRFGGTLGENTFISHASAARSTFSFWSDGRIALDLSDRTLYVKSCLNRRRMTGGAFRYGPERRPESVQKPKDESEYNAFGEELERTGAAVTRFGY